MTSREPNEWRVNVVIQGVDLANGTVCGSMEALDVPQAEGPVITFWTGEIIDNVNNFFRTRRWIVPYDKDMQHWGCFVAFSDLIEQLGPEENANDIIYDDDDNDNDDMDTTTTASNALLQLDSLEQNAPQRRSTSVERQQGGGQRARAAQQQEGRQQTGIVSPDSVNLSHHRYIFMRWKELFFVSPKGECGLTIAGFYYMCMDRHTGAILGFYHDPYCAPFQQLQLNAVSTRTGFAHADYSFN